MNRTSQVRYRAFRAQVLLVVGSAIGVGVFGCHLEQPAAPSLSPSMETNPVVATKGGTAPVAVTNLQQAFNLGIASMDSARFPVDKRKCKVTIQKSEDGWLMTVTSIPPTFGGEQIILIKPDGDVIVGFGL